MLAMLYFSIFHNPPSIDSRLEKTLPLFNHKLVFPTCANNFIIEVSLRGGEIVGVKTAKAIYYGMAAKVFRDYEQDIRRLHGALFPKFEKILILGNKNDKIRVR